MADREVDIRIKTAADTTGAKKAEKSLDDVATSAGHGSGGKPGAAKQLEGLKSASGRAGKAGSRMGSAMQQAGYQVGDFAVQVGAGQSALTALAQQGSQMLGIFGAGGALAGAALAVGAAIARGMGQARDAMQDTEADAEKLDEAFSAIAERVEKDVAEAMAKGFQEFAASMKHGVDRTKEINDELQRTIDLTHELERAKMEATSAEAAAQLAEIDANDTLSEPEKIRRRAAINKQVTDRKRAGELQAVQDATAPQEAAVRTARQTRADAAGNLEKARAEAAAKEKRIQELEVEVRRARTIEKRIRDAREKLPGAEKALPSWITETRLKRLQEDPTGLAGIGDPAQRAQVREVLQMRKNLKDLGASPYRMSTDGEGNIIGAKAKELEALKGSGEGSLAAVKERVGGLEKELSAAEGEVRNAEQAFAEVAANAKEVAEQLRRRFAAEDKLQTIKTGSELSKQPAYGPELPPKDYKEKKLRGRLGEAESAFQAKGEENSQAFGAAARNVTAEGEAGANLRQTLGGISKELANGSDAGEIQQLAEQFKQAVGSNKSATVNALREMLREQQNMAREIENLKGQIKHGGRDGR